MADEEITFQQYVAENMEFVKAALEKATKDREEQSGRLEALESGIDEWRREAAEWRLDVTEALERAAEARDKLREEHTAIGNGNGLAILLLLILLGLEFARWIGWM